MSGPWHSERLVYRAVEPEDESSILAEVSNDAEAFMNAAPFLPCPRSKKHATQFREYLDTMLLAAVICLPPPIKAAAGAPNGAESAAAQAIPIGIINLTGLDPRMIHHRRSEIGINIVRPYQGQGFGTEAIKWALNWGFTYANLHRIEIGAFGYNKGALKLYERMGFVPEGRKRDWMWHEGRFWDVCGFGMLENEWRERYGNEKKE
jgi:RimJ/RimL family protein N-acetyltransferase